MKTPDWKHEQVNTADLILEHGVRLKPHLLPRQSASVVALRSQRGKLYVVQGQHRIRVARMVGLKTMLIAVADL
jgi:hypothetical protein